MTNFPARDTGPSSPGDPPELLTEAAALVILLLPSDQSCAPARGGMTARAASRLPGFS